MEYSVFGAVRGQYGNYSWWVGEPLAYKDPPVTVQIIMKQRANAIALIFVPLLCLFHSFVDFAVCQPNCCDLFVPESVLHQHNL